jgi:hypothetical protein
MVKPLPLSPISLFAFSKPLTAIENRHPVSVQEQAMTELAAQFDFKKA